MRKEAEVPVIVSVWWQDVTLWTNVVAVAALVLNNHFGYAITPELQASILAIINVILKVPKMSMTKAGAVARNAKARQIALGL